MRRPNSRQPKIEETGPVPASEYTKDYFLAECDGYRSYHETSGAEPPERLRVAHRMARIEAGQTVLDIGCGRGETVRSCSMAGARAVGVDYSLDALALARQTLDGLPTERKCDALLVRSDAKRLPFASSSFDRVLMLDIVEHLHEWELREAFREVARVLKPDGRLLVHTMPNRWYYAVGYPLYRLVSGLAGRPLPRNPRHRWKYVEHVHVNEQDVLRLRRVLVEAGLRPRVWLQHVESEHPVEPRVVTAARRVLASVFPLSLVFCNDIFAVAMPDAPEPSPVSNTRAKPSAGAGGSR